MQEQSNGNALIETSQSLRQDKLTGPSVAMGLNNALQFTVFQITGEGRLRRVIQTANGTTSTPPSWSNPLDLGAPDGVKLESVIVAQNLTTISYGGALEVFAVGENGAVWHCRQTSASNTGWSRWESLGRPSLDPVISVSNLQVALVQQDQNAPILILFALGSDALLWSRRQQTPQLSNSDVSVQWSDWEKPYYSEENPISISAFNVATDSNHQNLQIFGIKTEKSESGYTLAYCYNTHKDLTVNTNTDTPLPSSVQVGYSAPNPSPDVSQAMCLFLNQSDIPYLGTYSYTTTIGNTWGYALFSPHFPFTEIVVAMKKTTNPISSTYEPLACFGIGTDNNVYYLEPGGTNGSLPWKSLGNPTPTQPVELSCLTVCHDGQGINVAVAGAAGSVWVNYCSPVTNPTSGLTWGQGPWSAVGTQATGTNYPDWMGGMSGTLQYRQIQQTSIPGTHDSGTSPFPSFSSPWQRTQDKNITEQLQAGIRYFDLHLGLDKNGVVSIVHGCCAAQPASAVVHAVDEFARAHPNEIILLDFNKLTNMDVSHNTSFTNSMITTFGSRIVPTSVTGAVNVTFDTLWTNRQQIFVFYADQETVSGSNGNLWLSAQPPDGSPQAGYPIFTHRPNLTTVDTNELISDLTNWLPQHTLPQFFLLQGIFTPDNTLIAGGIAAGAATFGTVGAVAGGLCGARIGELPHGEPSEAVLGGTIGARIGAIGGAVAGGVVGGFLGFRPFPGRPGSVEQLAQIANPAVLEWLGSLNTLHCIVIVDFFDSTGSSSKTAFVDAVIGFNQG